MRALGDPGGRIFAGSGWVRIVGLDSLAVSVLLLAYSGFILVSAAFCRFLWIV